MKQSLVTCLILSVIAFTACKKNVGTGSNSLHEGGDVDAPTADFALYQLDSAKVYTFTQGKIDTLSSQFVPDYIIPMQEGVSTRAYKGKVILKYTGSASKFRVVYTGDATHVYVADPASPPAGVTGSQSGVNFTGDVFAYNYPVAGTYTITVISSNEGDKGRDIVRSVASKKIILR
jgi:hypothetical protein